jgi:hypothetical protein
MDDFDQIDIPGYVFKLKKRKTKSRNKSKSGSIFSFTFRALKLHVSTSFMSFFSLSLIHVTLLFSKTDFTRYPEFENVVCKHDIICLQETKTDDFDQIDIPGYIFKLNDRKKTKSRNKSGGIALGFKEQLSDKISPVETGIPRFQILGNVSFS